MTRHQQLALRVHLPGARARLLGFIVLLAASVVAASILPTAALPTPAPGQGRCNMSTTTLPDLKILRAGGISCNFTDPTASVDIYDPTTLQSKPAGNLTMARYDHSALRLSDGRVLIVGGEGPDKQPTLEVEIYDPSTRTSHLAGSIATPRCSPSITQLADGDVLLAGGSLCPPYPVQRLIKSIELYNVKTGHSGIVSEFRVTRYLHDATLLKDGRVLFTSGIDSEREVVGENEIYDPATNKLTAAGAMTVRRIRESIVPLRDGTVLFAGGVRSYRYPDNAYKSAEIFDPRTNQFRPVGDMNSGGYCPGTALLKDGRVLLAGGAWSTTDVRPLNTAELYEPKSQIFSPTGKMTTARTCPATKLLPDGTVLVQGGFFSGGVVGYLIRSSERYDSTTGKFTAVPEAQPATEPVASHPASH